MTDVVPTSSPLPHLAAPGERLGWIFNDRNLYRRKYMEPPPQPGTVPPQLLTRAQLAEQRLLRRILMSLGIGAGLAVVIACCGGILSLTGGSGDGPGIAVGVFAFLAVLGGVGGAVASWAFTQNAKRTVTTTQEDLAKRYASGYEQWDARRQWHEHQQQIAVDDMTEWGAAAPSQGTRRVDIIGGTTWGWEAVLTVFGGSLLSTRGPMTLVDFTGEALCGELVALATSVDRTVHVDRLPSELPRLDLVGGLEPQELVDCLVESMHGDAQGANRAERSQDTLLLNEVCAILAPDLSIGRLIAALRVLTDRGVQTALTAEESDRLLDMMPDETRRQTHGHLRRMEAFLHPLEAMGTEAVARTPADLTCLVADSDGRNAQNELLKDLIVQWLTRQVRRSATPMGSLVLVGADDVDHRHVERLSTLCERRGVRLVLFFGHLREQSLHSIGGGEVAFMRLGNHQEAQQAADFIGKQHKFVISQLTRTLGGNDTHTLSDQYGESESQGGSTGSSRSRFTITRSTGRNWGTTRNWSQTESVAKGTNWSDAASAQRVHEYAVEPRVLQDLPDYAMILVKSEGRGSVVQAVEVDPAIVTLPRVSMTPLDLQPLPDPAEAVVPATRQPSQVTVSQPQPLAAHEARVQDAMPNWGAPDSREHQP